MNTDSILRKDDCEVARTPEELIAWIESLDMAKACAGEEKILDKVFREEIRPLGHLARHKYLRRPAFYLHPKIGNQNYDAELIDTSSVDERIQRVEFTSTYRDKALALRMEVLAQRGGVPMTGSVRRDGTKASGGQVQVYAGCAVPLQVLLDRLMATCEERVAKKNSQGQGLRARNPPRHRL